MGRKKIKKMADGDDEQICRRKIGKWKCKNVRSDNKFRFCEKHYKDYKALQDYCRDKSKLRTKNREGEVAVAGCSATGVETRGSKSRNKVIEDQSLDEAGGIQPPTTHIEGGSANVGNKRIILEGTEESAELDFTYLLTENPSNEMKKEKEMEKKKLPPDEQYFCQTAGKGWSKKFLPKTSGDGGGADAGCSTARSGDGGGADAGRSTATGPVEFRRSKRMKPATKEDETRENQPATSDNTSNTIVEDGGSPKIGMKRKTVEKAQRSGDQKSVTKTGEPVVELESLEHYKSKCFKLTVELEKQKMELEKKNAEYTTLQRKYAELETKKTAAEDEDAVKYWRNKCSDLESLILRMEIENPRMQCGVSRVSNLESLVTRNSKGSSISRCEELRNCGKIEFEVQGSQHEITESGENQRYKDNMSTLNTETRSGGRENSRVYELKADVKYSTMNISSGSLHLASGGENIEEGNGWGCSEGRPLKHGSSSQAHLRMSKKIFVNLVSDSDDESVDSLGDPMDMRATENWSRNKHEMKWKSEVDMLSSLEEDHELCLKAVCALYRQEISEDETSPKGLVIDSDTVRCTTLAKFLMGEDCKGDLKKSVAELEKFDSKAVGDCKKLVRRYSMYLFDIYENRKDPFFVPATNASNGDKTAK